MVKKDRAGREEFSVVIEMHGAPAVLLSSGGDAAGVDLSPCGFAVTQEHAPDGAISDLGEISQNLTWPNGRAEDDSEWKDGAKVKRKAACWKYFMCNHIAHVHKDVFCEMIYPASGSGVAGGDGGGPGSCSGAGTIDSQQRVDVSMLPPALNERRDALL
ncbi:hypothetical protein CYMTET_43708 [Cymbomonas tetramitiformis]|uniref:Uncharacterized protein n=1 Tax=Cymbomonas tetramitiformis TaxID=36881 RepID=A0AAE0C2Y0_9CHLO|nr:hypothetical protein CYMTET_43708 [Cymbomonas tetramitiformis]